MLQTASVERSLAGRAGWGFAFCLIAKTSVGEKRDLAPSPPQSLQAGCAVNLTPKARATFMTVSNRGLAPGASAL